MNETIIPSNQSNSPETGVTNNVLRALIADDSEDDVFFLLRALREAGYELVYERVSTAPAMKTALERQAWDIVISDFEMPHFGGFEALQLLKESGHDLPFILVSAVVNEETAVAAMKAGADDYIMKHKLARLAPAIERELREAQMRLARKAAEKALHQSEEQLRQAQKMEAVGQLAAGVAHDFNNLLTVINGYCAMALQKKEEVQPIRKNIEEIQKAAYRAASLTSQLLAFSRKQVLQPRVLQLNEVVCGMEKMLRRLIGEDVELSTTFDSELGNVKADSGQIEQVIMNLAVNARDAMPRGGKLTISTSNATIDQKSKFRNRTLEVGEYAMIAISDNGAGMTDEVKTHLFEPFFTTKRLGKGTGLGLATCYAIICQSGGDIRVYSELNSGTTFNIYLPRTDATLEPVATVDLEHLPAGTESILIVEDDPSVRELAVIILRNCGYQVQESDNAFEALRLIERNPEYNLVITDVIMPQMSGKELYDQIKSQLPQIKVLLMSGYTDDALAHHGVLDENLSFLEKPFSPSKLAGKVRGVLDAPALIQHLPQTALSFQRCDNLM